MKPRIRKQSSPCLFAEIVMEIADAQMAGASPTPDPETFPSTLDDLRRNGPRDRLFEHCTAFLMGICIIVAVDVARSSGIWWSLMVIGGWAVLLAIHAVAFRVRGTAVKDRGAAKRPTSAAGRIAASVRAGRRLSQLS